MPKNTSDKKLRVLEAKAKSIQREIAKSSVYADGIKTDFWRKMEEQFRGKLESIDVQLDGYRKLDDRQIRDVLADRLGLRQFVGLKNHVKAKTYFENELKIVQERIRELRERDSR